MIRYNVFSLLLLDASSFDRQGGKVALGLLVPKKEVKGPEIGTSKAPRKLNLLTNPK